MNSLIVCLLLTIHLDSSFPYEGIKFFSSKSDAELMAISDGSQYYDKNFDTFEELREYEDINPQGDYFHYVECNENN